MNDVEAGADIVIEKARDVVFEAASTALNTKFDVVLVPTAVALPDMIAVPPSAAVFTKARPAGKVPDCISKVTLPADSGSVAFTDKLIPERAPSGKVPKEPAPVTYTGCAFILI